MPIPFILHQTWKTSEIPLEFRDYVASWKVRHPHWEYMLWTDEDNRALIEEHYSWFLPHYDSLPTKIQKVDAVRYFILHRFGGLYVDLDFECLRNFDELMQNFECFMGEEPKSHALKVYNRNPAAHGGSSVICNALMASTVEHPLWPLVWSEMMIRLSNPKYFKDVLHTTGPAMLDDCVRKVYKGKSEIVIWPPDMFFSKVAQGYKQHKILQVEPWAIHHWANTWIKKTS